MLRQLMLTRKLAELKKALEEARAKAAGFLVRKKELEEREKALVAAVNEVTDETSAEDKQAVEELVAEHEEAAGALEAEEAENAAEEQRLTQEIKAVEGELEALNNRAAAASGAITRTEQRGEIAVNEKRVRNKFGDALVQIVERDDMKGFLLRVREHLGEKRAVKGGELGIPDVMLELLRDNTNRYSKLISKVNVRSVHGTVRQNIAGTVPEAIWTEACGSLNELDIYFNQITADGFKVGGFIPICNATKDDSDLNLASEILDMLGQAIGLAIDKAILYGTGVKMPTGIVTRLAQTAQPSDWNADAPTWTDLHASHILKMDPASYATNEAFFAALILYLTTAKRNYSTGSKFWVMNENTWNTLVSRTVMFNAAGALVASQQMTMPIVGGDIVLLDFIPNYDIIGGYGSLYLMVERAGAEMAQSEHVRFLDDQTVFKGTARYDGKPVFGEGFLLLNINNTNPTTSIQFAPDAANIVVPPATMPAPGNFTGTTDVFLSTSTPNAYIYYTTDGKDPTTDGIRYGAPVHLTKTTTIKAITRKAGAKDSSITEAVFTKA